MKFVKPVKSGNSMKYPPGNQHILTQGMFEDDFPLRKVGYVSSLVMVVVFKSVGHFWILSARFFHLIPPHMRRVGHNVQRWSQRGKTNILVV